MHDSCITQIIIITILLNEIQINDFDELSFNKIRMLLRLEILFDAICDYSAYICDGIHDLIRFVSLWNAVILLYTSRAICA